MGSVAQLAPVTCRGCPTVLPLNRQPGRPRAWCSEACRHKAWRARRRRDRLDGPWLPPPPVPRGFPGFPVDRETVDRRTAAGLLALLEGRREAPPEDQLMLGLVEVDQLASRFGSIADSLPSRLAGRAGEMAKVLAAARRRLFPYLDEDPA